MSRKGVVLGLEGAHPACAGPLIERLREGGADVHVCFSAREILAAPAGSRIVLLHAARDAEFLNMVRPVIAERRLRVFVWLQLGDRRELRRRARDFLDWMQATVDVPDFVPTYATTGLRRALDDRTSVLWEGRSLRELIPDVTVLHPDANEDDVLAAMRQGPVVVQNARGADEVGRFEALRRAVGGSFGIIWEEPDVQPAHAERIIAKPLDWEIASAWLEGAGVQEPRIEAAQLDLDPLAVSRRAGRAPPPLFAAEPEAGHVVDRITKTGPATLRVLFPAGPVTLTAGLDSQGQLELRHQGTPLSYYDEFEIIEDQSSLPVKLEICDFYSGASDWTITAHHEIHAWARGQDRCYSDVDQTDGAIEVVVIASSSTGSRSQARSFFLEIKSSAELDP